MLAPPMEWVSDTTCTQGCLVESVTDKEQVKGSMMRINGTQRVLESWVVCGFTDIKQE